MKAGSPSWRQARRAGSDRRVKLGHTIKINASVTLTKSIPAKRRYGRSLASRGRRSRGSGLVDFSNILRTHLIGKTKDTIKVFWGRSAKCGG